MRRLSRALVVLVAVVVLGVAYFIPVSVQAELSAERSRSAISALDGPGATSYLDLGRKDCLGTATSQNSRVWFTVADGVLSDVYSPTTDNTNLSTLQYLVTDGRSFTDLQARDTTYTVRALDSTHDQRCRGRGRRQRWRQLGDDHFRQARE